MINTHNGLSPTSTYTKWMVESAVSSWAFIDGQAENHLCVRKILKDWNIEETQYEISLQIYYKFVAWF